MRKATVKDKYGNEIYITEERWRHIVIGHAEMRNNFDYLLKTIRIGKRKQDRENPAKFFYTQKFKHLPPGTVLMVVVKFGFSEIADRSSPNNFVLSAYVRRIK